MQVAAQPVESLRECFLVLYCVFVLQVVTDSAAACRAAGALIEVEYPHITWSPCVAHVCDLALEDIFKLDYFKEVHTTTKGFVTFINNNHHTLSAWRQHQATAGGSMLQLVKPGETRFASPLLMIERTISVKAKLQQFVVSHSWNNAINTMKRHDKVRVCCGCGRGLCLHVLFCCRATHLLQLSGMRLPLHPHYPLQPQLFLLPAVMLLLCCCCCTLLLPAGMLLSTHCRLLLTHTRPAS